MMWPSLFQSSLKLCPSTALECIQYELILNQMLAHGLKRHIEPSIVSGPPTFHIAWPEDCADNSFCYTRPFFRESKNKRKSQKKTLKTEVFGNSFVFEATLCGNPAVES